jgi:hypothetical protein
MEFDPKEGELEYNKLDLFAEVRLRELSKLLKPLVSASDQYGRLLCRITWVLGHTPLQHAEDSAVRDLVADVFDFLYHSRKMILTGALGVAYLLLRRAFESLSLLVLFTFDTDMTKKWASGVQISNSEVRKKLGRHPMGESEESLREFYRFFSTTTHPNREVIPSRYLGEGNAFVLGSIGQPDLPLVFDFCIKYLDLWFWFAAAVTYNYRELLSKQDRGHGERYLEATKEFETAKLCLIENYNQLLSRGNLKSSIQEDS